MTTTDGRGLKITHWGSSGTRGRWSEIGDRSGKEEQRHTIDFLGREHLHASYTCLQCMSKNSASEERVIVKLSLSVSGASRTWNHVLGVNGKRCRHHNQSTNLQSALEQ